MTPELFKNPKAARQKLAADPHRPAYHFLPPRNWMNDPNGLFFWKGKAHLFYQFNPFDALWGSIHWGHASSADMVFWEDHPLALAPEKGAGDDQGCFSGCLVENNGTLTAIYTGFVNPTETPVLIAEAQDAGLIRWQKSPHNPVIPDPPEGVIPTDFRDPYVWQEGTTWKLVIGAGMQDGDSAALLYQSRDLLSWDYLGPLFKTQTFESVRMWECPNFFKIDDQYVLLVSLFPDVQGVYYYVGSYDGRVFSPRTEGFLDQGPIVYAPHVRQDSQGRTVLFAWLLEGRNDAAIKTAGWAGVQSLPRVLALDDHCRLISRPISQLAKLRKAAHACDGLSADITGKSCLGGVQGRHLEIELRFDVNEGQLRLGVLASPGGEEATWIIYDGKKGEAVLDTTQSSLSPMVSTARQCVRLPEKHSSIQRLHAFVDGSVIEAWFDDGTCLTGRAYPTLPGSQTVQLQVEGSGARLLSARAWEMDAIWLKSA